MWSSTFFDELRNAPAALLLTSQKCLEMRGHHPVEHGLFGIARAVRVGPLKTGLNAGAVAG